MYETIAVEKKDGIATLTINRPEVSNAFTAQTYQEIAGAVKELDRDDEVNVIVITGAGKNFSAGGDIKRFNELIKSGEYLSAEAILESCNMPKAIRACSKPTIAMVNGAAAGAGLSCALACDFRIADPRSKFLMAFINLGLCGDNGGTYMLARLIGVEQAALMMMTGEPVGGEKAAKIGLATVCVEESDLVSETYKFATKIATRSRAAIAAQKKLLTKYNYDRLNEACEDESKLMRELSLGTDFSEAVTAFLEKRKPVFNKQEG